MPSNSLKNNNPKTPRDTLPYNNAFGFYIPETEINKIYNILALKVAKYILLIPYGIARFTNHDTIALIMGAGHIALDYTGNYYRFKYSMETLNSYLKYFSTYEEYIEPKIAVLVSLFYKPYDIAENLTYSLSSFTYNKILEPITDQVYPLISYKYMKPCFKPDINKDKIQQGFYFKYYREEDPKGFKEINIKFLPYPLKLCLDQEAYEIWEEIFNTNEVVLDLVESHFGLAFDYEYSTNFPHIIPQTSNSGLYFYKCPYDTKEISRLINEKPYKYPNQEVKYAVTNEAHEECFANLPKTIFEAMAAIIQE
ncbi:hypothetical protein H1Q59_03720 [Holosporaceae bacterium 'Namur']|nr:hypothetical protein [Holosporaceae bacterium 'Namur']